MPTMLASNPPMREATKKGFMETIVYNGAPITGRLASTRRTSRPIAGRNGVGSPSVRASSVLVH